MSVRVMTRVWDLSLPDSDKIVLLALADCANDEGHCWPGIASLVRKCSKSERTIQASIKRLVDDGHLTRREVLGKGCNYTVHPRSDCTPADTAPPQGTTQTPAAAAGKPSRTIKSGAKAPSSGARHFIPVDWKAPAIADLPPRASALAEQWTDASYQTEAEAFGCYWRSERKMKGDWDDTWANRIVARHSAIMRDQKYGNAPTDIKRDLTPTEELENLRRMVPTYEAAGRPDYADQARARIAELEGNNPAMAGKVVRLVGGLGR